MIRTTRPILLAFLAVGTGAAMNISCQNPHPLDAALAPATATESARGPLEVRGTAKALWLTSEKTAPIAGGTFALRRDRLGGIAVRIDLAAMGRIVYAADAVAAWSDHPEGGAMLYEGKPGAPIRRLLAALVGDGRWRMVYPSAKPTDAKPPAGRVCFALGGRDHWEIDPKTGRIHEAVVHLGDERDATRVTVRFHDFTGEDSFPRRITIDLRHHRYVLATERVRRGDEVGETLVQPTKEFVAKAKTITASDDEAAIKIATLAEVHLASIRKRVAMTEISKELGSMFPEIMFALQKQGIQPIGAPLTRYHDFGDGKNLEIEAAFPVAKPITAAGRIKPSRLPGGRVAITWHIGPYQTLGKTHAKLGEWIASHDLRPNGGLWEVYWTDPGLEPNPEKWRTQIVAPVAAK